MLLNGKSLVVLLGLSLSSVAYAADPPAAANNAPNFAADSGMILPASGERWRAGEPASDRSCYSMRTYRVRKNMDRGSVIPSQTDDVSFDPNDVIGYSTCQRAGKFAVKTTQK